MQREHEAADGNNGALGSGAGAYAELGRPSAETEGSAADLNLAAVADRAQKVALMTRIPKTSDGKFAYPQEAEEQLAAAAQEATDRYGRIQAGADAAAEGLLKRGFDAASSDNPAEPYKLPDGRPGSIITLGVTVPGSPDGRSQYENATGLVVDAIAAQTNVTDERANRPLQGNRI